MLRLFDQVGLGLALSAMVTPALAQAVKPGDHVSFIACPILRTTEFPCWMARSGGELYFVGVQDTTAAVFKPPEFQHQMLVEGEVAAGDRICGGVPLKNVTVSVRTELDPTCNIIIPAEGYASPPHNRGAGPASIQQKERPPALDPKPPFTAQDFHVQYLFEREHPWILEGRQIEAAMRYALASHASRIEVVGYRGAAKLSDGTIVEEPAGMARWRAELVAEALRDLHVEGEYSVKWKDEVAGYALADRRVDIRVIP